MLLQLLLWKWDILRGKQLVDKEGMLVGIVEGKGAIATNESAWWFTPLGEKVVINPLEPNFNET
jgi:hypothetical protein